jgi:molecular chaperone GrpE (heat shock protein)
MTDPIEISKDNDFSEELRALVLEATQGPNASQKPATATTQERGIREDELRALLKPILEGIESRNTVSKSMFEALHTELKTYKDAFILEAVLRPVIRDMISIFDDLGDTHRQLAATIATLPESEVKGSIIALVENIRRTVNNLDHNIHFILEVLERLDVTQMPVQPGKLDKRTQKAVAIEHTPLQAEDFDSVRTIRRGFQWRDRIVRPEEVVVKKWRESKDAIIASPPVPEANDSSERAL